MKPAPFKYLAPTTVEEALSLLQEHNYEAKLLAGGQSLIPTMNFRMAQPGVIIDIGRIPELAYIRNEKDKIVIGAMTRHCELEDNALIQEHAPLIHETMPYIAHPQIRNQGTIGGSIAHADPSAELPAVMIALDATFVIQNTQGQREVAAKDFFVGLFATALEEEDILTAIVVPHISGRCGWGFAEIARRHGDYAIVGVTATMTLDKKDVCQRVSLVYLSVGDAPVVAQQAQESLVGKKLSEDLLQTAAQIASSEDMTPGNDIHASSDYRRHLAKVLGTKVLTQAWQRALAK